MWSSELDFEQMYNSRIITLKSSAYSSVFSSSALHEPKSYKPLFWVSNWRISSLNSLQSKSKSVFIEPEMKCVKFIQLIKQTNYNTIQFHITHVVLEQIF